MTEDREHGGYVTLQSLPGACGAGVRQSSPRYGKAEGPCPGTTGTASWLPAFGNSRQAVGAFHQSLGSYCTQTIRIRVNRVDNVVRDDTQFFSQSLFPAKFKHDKAHYISASTLSLWNKKAWMFPKSHSRLEELFIKFLAELVISVWLMEVLQRQMMWAHHVLLFGGWEHAKEAQPENRTRPPTIWWPAHKNFPYSC